MNVQDSTVVAVLTNGDKVAQMIADLQEKLTTVQPGWESLLQMIHSTLQRDPDVVHLLTEEQVGIVVSGLQKKTGLVLAVDKAKPKKGEKIQLSEL